MREPSGRFVIRIPKDLHERLRREAMHTGRSLNRVCIEKLQAERPSCAAPGTAAARAGPISPESLDEISLRWSDDLVGLVLFGSVARGEATENSDIDLLLVMRPEARITRSLYSRWEAFCRESGGMHDLDRISPHFVNLPRSVSEAGGLWYEAALEGIVLRERDCRVSRFLRSAREAVAHGRIRRRWLHGSPYWIKEFEGSDA